jgi:hypothetical protein
MRVGLIGILLMAAAACARVMSPTGGEPDKEPPRIVETDPAQNAPATQHAGTTRPVRIIFHETLSERGPREMVLVSPETGEVDVERDGKELRVTIEGGWQAGKIYRVTVLPGLLDRFGNARTTAHELVFSTGAAIPSNVLGGLVTDRITGRPVANARVEAISRADSTPYTTVTDTGGFYALRALPPGMYDTRIYADQNRNRRLDRFEAVATLPINVATDTDTLVLEFALLARDTTPARLLRADIRDSLQVRLSFDDYMDPAGGLPAMRITAWQLPDSTQIAGGTIMTPREFTALRARADTARTRAAAAAADTARVLPINELVWVPATPLRAGTRYRISLTGYRNLAGLPDGGGSVVATAPAAVRAPTPPARDTIRQ